MEKTLVLIKPDAIQRGLTGEIIRRLENTGLKLVAMKLLQINQDLANKHYSEHVGKTFFSSLVSFITSSPVVAIVLEGKGAIENVRKIMGKTDPIAATPGTIRGDLALDLGRNLIHGSDSPESAQKEIALFFDPSEVLNYNLANEIWITEA